MARVLRLEPGGSTAKAVWWTGFQSALAASLGLALLDLLIGGGGFAAWLVAGGTAALVGGVGGAAWGGLMALSREWSSRLRIALWLTLSLTVFGLLARALSAFANLGGRYHTLALGVMAACVVGGLFFGALTVMISRGADGGTGWLAARGQRTRLMVGGLLLGGAVVAAYLDRTLFPGGYAPAHLALRIASIYLVTCGLFLQGARLTVGRVWLSRTLKVAGVGLVASPFMVLDDPLDPAATAVLERPLAAVHLDAVRDALDVDGDGYAHLLGGGDCAPFDGAVGPGAREIPGNGIDDNCLGGDAEVREVSLDTLPVPTSASPMDVLLITVDTLRPDRMSAYGYGRKTTPNIARFAGKATRFDAAYTLAGWTSIAVPAFMRGVYARRLDWHLMYETNRYRYFRPPIEGKLADGEKVRARFLLPLEDRNPTLATLLARRGMRTSAVVDGGFTEILAKAWGAGAGFDEFVDLRKVAGRRANDGHTATQAVAALRRLRAAGEPFFLWVHFFGPHAPSSTHKGSPRYGASEADRYDHEVHFMDRQVGRLLNLASQPNPRPLATVLTSDHGERFFNTKTRGHGWGTTEDYIRVPLIVWAPGLPPGTVDTLAGSVDLVTTLLDLTETPGPVGLDGMNLAEVVKGTPAAKERVLFFDTFGVKKAMGSRGFRVNKVVALRGKHKLVANRISGATKASLRATDKGVSTKAVRGLQDALNAYLESAGGVPAVNYGGALEASP